MRFALLIVALCVSPAARAQDAPPTVRPQSLAGEDVPAVELDATLVEVPVVVSQTGGRYVTDLREGDFVVLEDGVRQKVSFFASVEEPFDVALVLDCSGSTRDKLDRIKEAALGFLDQLRPHDRVAVVTFDDEVRVVSELTSDREALRRAIAEMQTGAFSQVYEAVHASVDEVLGVSERRKAAILFTDGVDTASAIADFDDTLAEVARRQVIVYPIRYDTRAEFEARQGLAPNEPGTRPRRVSAAEQREQARREIANAYHIADAYLHELAERSGGVLHRADTIADLGPALARIAEELRHQYVLGYYPEKRKADDGTRAITVQVTRPGLLVRARPGYRLERRVSGTGTR